MQGKSFNAKLCEEMAEGKENPFHTLEAMSEHSGAIWGWYRRQGYQMPDRENNGVGKMIPVGSVGSFDYHMIALDNYLRKVFNALCALEPELKAVADGEDDSGGAMILLRERLKALAEMHQHNWEEFD